MALAPTEMAGPFTKLDKQSVIGTLKSIGTRDPDVLYAQKQKLLAPSKNLKMVSYILMGGGLVFTLTIVVAFAGIPLGLFGIWMWRFSTKNIATVDAAFSEYLGSAATAS